MQVREDREALDATRAAPCPDHRSRGHEQAAPKLIDSVYAVHRSSAPQVEALPMPDDQRDRIVATRSSAFAALHGDMTAVLQKGLRVPVGKRRAVRVDWSVQHLGRHLVTEVSRTATILTLFPSGIALYCGISLAAVVAADRVSRKRTSS
jgi:hypothetical protein